MDWWEMMVFTSSFPWILGGPISIFPETNLMNAPSLVGDMIKDREKLHDGHVVHMWLRSVH
jgi:hypothetical protein